MANHKSLHYLNLVAVIALGTVLRFWHLDFKPLWMDEVITAIFSLGKSYSNVPLDVVFPLEHLQQIFNFQPGVSCPQIAQTVATHSTHPPLFFCAMHTWLGWMSPLGKDWVMKLRSLPALFGVGLIVAIYYVNRVAFSPSAGITAAAIMAVSPFAVYLSQEARHYTLPMLLITLALLGLLQIQQDIEKPEGVRFSLWLGWVVTNSIGLYVHYFFILAFIAEIATLLMVMYWRRANMQNHRRIWLGLILSSSSVAISFLPWLLVMLNHSRRAETDWLPSPEHIAPFYQTFVGWVLMVIALPLENQPLPIVIISGLLMVLFGIWVAREIFKGLRQLFHTSSSHLTTVTLLIFLIWILLEFFAIAYFLKKDITAIPRYNFVYYPSFCALIAASLDRSRKSKCIILIISTLSSLFVTSNLVFQKPFQPEKVAHHMNQNSSIPIMVVMAYRGDQDVALGLSFALALEPLKGVHEKSSTPTPTKVGVEEKNCSLFPSYCSRLPSSNFAFFKQSPDFQSVWQKLSQANLPRTSPMNLWIIGPGRKHQDYPQQVVLSQESTCTIDPKQYYRIGIPYQLYRCNN